MGPTIPVSFVLNTCAVLLCVISFETGGCQVLGFPPQLIHGHRTYFSSQLLQNKHYSWAATSGECDDEPSELPPPMNQVDILYGSRTSLIYDAQKERYLPQSVIQEAKLKARRAASSSSSALLSRPFLNIYVIYKHKIRPYLSAAFLPEGVTPAYYRYTTWRTIQRLINANLQVFGTQSLLLGLGIKAKASSLGALSAALNWVLKDALGKIVRMIWASKMGGRFDSDAKRWRFRASLLYATGNGLEIVTFLFPQFFLLWATTANCCKQMAMLTCSSTRTALYNSFRDGTTENIGDITAKGEASIAVVDLIGIGTGVTLSRAMGTAVGSVLTAYFVLQFLEIFSIYRMMRTVHFRVFNFERLVQTLEAFVGSLEGNIALSRSTPLSIPDDVSLQEPGSQDLNMIQNNASTANATAYSMSMPEALSNSNNSQTAMKTPAEMALTEKIIQLPSLLSRRAIAFGSLGRTKVSPDECLRLLDIFSREKFLLVVGKNVKHPRLRRPDNKWLRPLFFWRSPDDPLKIIKENCHIVLHAEATNADIVKSTLALVLLRQKLATALQQREFASTDPDDIRSCDCYHLLVESCREADRLLPRLLRQMANHGWTSPARFMFGRVTMRAEWPLRARHSASKPLADPSTSLTPRSRQSSSLPGH